MSVRAGCKPKIPLKFELPHAHFTLSLFITIPPDYPSSAFSYELRASNDHAESSLDDFDRVFAELRTFYDTQLSSAPDTVTIVNFVKLFLGSESPSSITQDSGLAQDSKLALRTPRACYTCHKCRCLLFTSEEIEPHNLLSRSQLCSSIFLNEPTEWMQDVSEVEGKVSCPRCASRVGSYSWAGLMCSCGEWVTPAIKFTKSKIDLKIMA